ncbi:hypothetical protein BASA81_015043 [Batrachochytrium salamandrivorans]|nr:hypothetical protein BASA81_015043 [Batrachochytrium salamandrivorans]
MQDSPALSQCKEEVIYRRSPRSVPPLSVRDEEPAVASSIPSTPSSPSVHAVQYTEVNLIKSSNTPQSQRNRIVALLFTILFLISLLWFSVFDSHQDSDVGGPELDEIDHTRYIRPLIYLSLVMIVLGLLSCWFGLQVHQEDESNTIRVVRGDSDLDKIIQLEEEEEMERTRTEPSLQQRMWAEQALGKPTTIPTIVTTVTEV